MHRHAHGFASRKPICLADGSSLFISDSFSSLPRSATSEVDEPARDKCRVAAPMRSALSGHTATLLPGGCVLVTGGTFASDFSSATSERYESATGVWRPTAPMRSARSCHTAPLRPYGSGLFIGGATSDRLMTNTAEVFEPPAASGLLPRACT